MFKSCQFTGNTAKWRGGAAYFDYGSRPTLTDCVFRDNTTDGHGGAIFSCSRASQLENTIVACTGCRFEENSAKGYGGAANFHDSSIGILQKCTFTGNKSGLKGNAIAVTSNSTLQAQGNTVAAGDVFQEPVTGPFGAGGGSGMRGQGIGRRLGAFEPAGQGGGAGMGMRAGPGQRMMGANSPTRFQPAADFSVITVGTGSPQYDPQRSGPCDLIQYRGHYVLVDMGNGTQARLYQLGVRWPQIDAILFTHHHLDHDEEFIPVFIHTHLIGHDVPVIGTPGTQKYVDFIEDFYAQDISYRLERMGRTMADFGKAPVREVLGGETFTLDGMKVTVAKVNHTIYPVGYRFDADGKSIVISGDTTYSDNLVKLAKGADVLVMDSGGAPVREGMENRPGGGRGDPLHAHSSRQEVCEMAQQAGVKKLVLTHIGPGAVDEAATKQVIGQIYKGQVLVGHDLLEVVPG
jgi:ribonuclease BN (tRNA processing enzyme)